MWSDRYFIIRKLRLNTAIFYTDYTDRQLTTIRISPEGRIAGALINAKSSYISGIEMEAVILPTDNLQLTANVTFNHGEIKEYDDFFMDKIIQKSSRIVYWKELMMYV